MGSLIELDEFRRRAAARKGFTPWTLRFGTSFHENTSVRLLDNDLIRRLIKGDEESSTALYELIMGIKGLGSSTRFGRLEGAEKMEVTDITLFLLDLVRFEAMFRLGWLEDYALLEIPMVDLIMNFKEGFSAARHNSPAISISHELYHDYEAEFSGDRHLFVRKLIPEAIRIFCDTADDPMNK